MSPALGPVDSNNRPDGSRGIKVYSDGSVYIGGWLKGLRHHVEIDKAATWSRPDGSQYEGSWMNDLKHGRGRQRYPDGSTYSGEFAQNFEHGNGLKIFGDNSRFEGRFRYGKRDGMGMLIHPNGIVDKGIFKDSEASYHEPILPKILEENGEDSNAVIFQADSLLALSIKAVAKIMKTKRSLVPIMKLCNKLQNFLKPLLTKEYLSILNPLGSQGFLENSPLIAFQQLKEIHLNYVKFKNYDMESFLYFTSLNKSLTSLELLNNRIDPTSVDMINKQIANKTWPFLTRINLSFNKLDATAVSNLLSAINIGVHHLSVLKLSGCNINSTGAEAIAR
jgi:hypothetical protein